jgi:hypothetical protein
MSDNYSEIEKKMKLWRIGLLSLSETGYIQYHLDLANKSLPELEKSGFKIVKTWIESDGWGDSMKVLYAEIKKGNITKKVKYHDFHSKGSWYETGCGSFPLSFD